MTYDQDHFEQATDDLNLSAFDDNRFITVETEKLPNGFAMMTSGLRYTPPARDGAVVEPVRVCQAFIPVAHTTDELSERPGTLIRWTDRRLIEHEWVIPNVLLHDERNMLVTELTARNFEVDISAPKPLLKAFFAKLQLPRFVRNFDRAGWQTDGRLFVLPNGEGFGEDAENATLSIRRLRANTQRGGQTEWQQQVAALAVGNSRLIMAVCAGLAGPMLDITGEEFSAFHLVGPSSCGKSTAGIMAASIWGVPRDEVRSWRSTDNGLEGIAAEATDTLLVLDEMGQADPRVIGEVTYMLANGTGKARATRDGSAREAKRWRLSVLSTGELTVEHVLRSIGKQTPGGVDVRMVNIPADAGRGMGMFSCIHGAESPASFANMIRDRSSQFCGAAGRMFVEKLAELRRDEAGADSLREMIADMMKGFIKANTPRDCDGQIVRVITKFAVAAVAGEFAAMMGILPWKAGVAEAGVRECIQAWLGARGSIRPKEERDVVIKVREFVARYGASRFDDIKASTIKDEELGDRYEPRINEREGVHDDDYFHFFPDGFAKLVAPMSANAAAKVLADEGLLDVPDNGRSTQTKRVRGVKMRVYSVRKVILERE